MERRRKLTIITESAIEGLLTDQLERLGAKGYTIVEARGKGARGVRTGDWDQNMNVQIDIICDESTAHRIVTYCSEHYYKNYAMILYLSDVDVIRPEKF
ncbi:MAG TPA: transcriptional regulator [Bacteroidota bacterium]|nr:transcriptional regulator [Bacteroidota bacterium]